MRAFTLLIPTSFSWEQQQKGEGFEGGSAGGDESENQGEVDDKGENICIPAINFRIYGLHASFLSAILLMS